MRTCYGRVSTRDQNPGAQHDALTAAGGEQIFTGTASGTLARRPGLDKALLVACRRGDQLVVTRLGRPGRSLEHLIGLSAGLHQRGAGGRPMTHVIVVHTSTDETAGSCTGVRTSRASEVPCTWRCFPRSCVKRTSEIDTSVAPLNP